MEHSSSPSGLDLQDPRAATDHAKVGRSGGNSRLQMKQAASRHVVRCWTEQSRHHVRLSLPAHISQVTHSLEARSLDSSPHFPVANGTTDRSPRLELRLQFTPGGNLISLANLSPHLVHS